MRGRSVAKLHQAQLLTFAFIWCLCVPCLSELDQHFDLDSADEANLYLLQLRSEFVTKPVVSRASVNVVEVESPQGAVVPDLPLDERAGNSPNATASSAETPLHSGQPAGASPSYIKHEAGQGQPVGTSPTDPAPNQIVCLLVALAIPVLFLLAYQMVVNLPNGHRYGLRHSSSPGYTDGSWHSSAPGYTDGSWRSGGGSPGGASMQSPISSYRVTSAQAVGTSQLVLGIPRALVPVAQETRIDVVNLGAGGGSILSAVVSERKGRPGIWLLAASQAPVAWLDTSRALLDSSDLQGPGPSSSQDEAGRYVVLHRTQNGGGSSPGAPPHDPLAMLALTRTQAGAGTLVAKRYSGGSQTGGQLLTVSLTPHGEVVAINSAQGALLASAEQGGGNPSHTVLSVSSGADVVLVVAAVVSAQKLHPNFSL